jgi:hypothetical protein
LDCSDGRKLTLRMASSDPALELRSVWHARPGRGPVRHWMFLANHSGGPVTIFAQESVEVLVVGSRPGDHRVWYFSDDRAIPDATGVYCDRVQPGYGKTLPVTSDGADWIPYVAVDSQGTCGVYLGWEWSNGRIGVGADDATGGARLMAGMGDSFRTVVLAGETFEVPAALLGAYTGDLDDAGNSIRRYLFHHNMPELLKQDASYPKVEWNAFAATGKSQGSWDPVESKYYPFIDDIAPLGFEEVVIDIGWWSSYGDPGHIVSDATDWPSGMAAAAKYARARGMRFGLYDNEVESLTSESGKPCTSSLMSWV